MKYVASPRHADLLRVTGPLSRNLEEALKRTDETTRSPDGWRRPATAAVGRVSGESYASCARVTNVIPVDVEVPGCPPTPLALLQGILAAVSAGSKTPAAS